MKTVEFMVNGRNITVDESGFWSVYNQLKEIADAENVRCAVDTIADDYGLTEDQIADCVEEICDAVIQSTEDSFDEHVMYYIGEYVNEHGLNADDGENL